MIKVCVICGKEFETNRQYQKCCSKPCSKENEKRWWKSYCNTDKFREKARKNRRAKQHAYCRLCGQLMMRDYSTGRKDTSVYHEECVIKDCVKTLKAGNKLTKAQYLRAYARGYEMTDLRELAMEE